MGLEKKVVSLRLDEELLRTLKTFAQAENRTVSNLIETVLITYTKEQKENQSGAEHLSPPKSEVKSSDV